MREIKSYSNKIRAWFSQAPLLGWLLGVLAAVFFERYLGTSIAETVGLAKIPVLFGFNIMLKKPFLIPGAVLYGVLVYVLPILCVARLTASLTNKVAARLLIMRIVVFSE